MKKMNIFVVDDDSLIRKSLYEALSNDSCSIFCFENGKEAMMEIQKKNPDLIVLDWDMPVMNGITFLTKLRQNHFDTPVIFLTVNESEEYKIEGLEKGADDYLCKPFSIAELKTRIKVVLRRYKKDQGEDEYFRNGDICLNSYNNTCTQNDKPVEISVTEFRLLEAFVHNPDRIFDREALMRIAFPEDSVSSDRSIDSHIKRLRKKISGERIKTVYGAGYKFV